jgi:hypothetical protein
MKMDIDYIIHHINFWENRKINLCPNKKYLNKCKEDKDVDNMVWCN